MTFEKALIVGDYTVLENEVQVKRRSLRFCLLIVVIGSFTTAMVTRVCDAYIQGDVWLAFSRRSDLGYPIAQILALIALVTLLFAVFGAKKKKSPR